MGAGQAYRELSEFTQGTIALDHPACCWVTMSQLIERPSPVPSPVGLVVTKG
jgi:hypothetical protein